jgi:hypothetical protein
VIGMLPAELQQITIYSAGVTTSAREAEAAKALINALTAPSTAPTYKTKGPATAFRTISNISASKNITYTLSRAKHHLRLFRQQLPKSQLHLPFEDEEEDDEAANLGGLNLPGSLPKLPFETKLGIDRMPAGQPALLHYMF